MTSNKIEINNKLWNGKDSETNYYGCVSLALSPSTSDMIIKVDADYNNNQIPEKPAGRMRGLWEEPYEVFEIFIASGTKEDYLEINIGPHGHYYIKMITKYGTDDNIILDSKPTFSMDKQKKKWTAVLTLPSMYLPEPDTDFDSSQPLAIKWYANANAIIGSGASREYFSAYPLVNSESDSNSSPNFHKPEMFQPILMEETEESRLTRLSSVTREKSFFGLRVSTAQSFSLPAGVSYNAGGGVFGFGTVTVESQVRETALKLKHDFRLISNTPLDKNYTKHFVDKEFSVLHGLAGKWKGLFSYKKRLLILTSKPRLMYFDPKNNSLKGIIPWAQGQPLKITKRSDNKFDIEIFDKSRTYFWTSLSHDGDSWITAISLLDSVINKK